MNLETVGRLVAEIETCKDDADAAHSKEDRLYIVVLNAIADGCPDAPLLAREALKTQGFDFERWCA